MQARKFKLNNVNDCNNVSCGVHCVLEGNCIPSWSRVRKYNDIFENIKNIEKIRFFFDFFDIFDIISIICTYMVLTVSTAVLLLLLLGS